MTAKSFRVARRSLFLGAIVFCAVPALGNTIFWLQNTSVATAPASLQLNGAPGSTGTLYLFGSSDTTRVGSIGFDLVSSDPNSLKFTSASYGPQNFTAWNLPGGTIAVTNQAASGINGIALPPAGSGFGPGSSIGNTLLLASVGYTLGTGFSSTLSLRVNDAGASDYAGNPLAFHVGSSSSALLMGDNVGASATIGTFQGCLCGVYVSSTVFKNVNPGSPGFVDYQFETLGDLPVPGPVTLTGIDGPYYGGPTPIQREDIKPATFDLNTGKFHWNTTGAVPGSYHWFVGASAQGYFGQGLIQIQIIPEPSALALMVGFGFGIPICRRSRSHATVAAN